MASVAQDLGAAVAVTVVEDKAKHEEDRHASEEIDRVPGEQSAAAHSTSNPSAP